jgi:hypothetical protein
VVNKIFFQRKRPKTEHLVRAAVVVGSQDRATKGTIAAVLVAIHGEDGSLHCDKAQQQQQFHIFFKEGSKS